MDGTKTVARTDAERGFGKGAGVIRSFIFDLEGTLVETEELKALSYASAAAELRPDLNEGEVIVAFGDLVGYSHVLLGMGDAAAGAMDKALG